MVNRLLRGQVQDVPHPMSWLSALRDYLWPAGSGGSMVATESEMQPYR
jgi:hypothetical protein